MTTRSTEQSTCGPAAGVRVTVRPLASPLPIGLLALTTGSALLSARQLHWVSTAQAPSVGWCLLAFVAPLQFSAFIFAVLAHDEGAATGLAVLSGTWAASGLLLVASPPNAANPTLGVLLCAAAGALLVPCAVTVASKPLMTTVLALLAARFALSGVYQLHAVNAVQTAAGVLGVVVSCLAWYSACAFALEDGYGRTVLPTLRARGFPSRSSIDDPDAVAGEAGVRSRL